MDAGNVVIKVLSLISSLLNPSKDILGNYIYLANVTIFIEESILENHVGRHRGENHVNISIVTRLLTDLYS